MFLTKLSYDFHTMASDLYLYIDVFILFKMLQDLISRFLKLV